MSEGAAAPSGPTTQTNTNKTTHHDEHDQAAARRQLRAGRPPAYETLQSFALSEA